MKHRVRLHFSRSVDKTIGRMFPPRNFLSSVISDQQPQLITQKQQLSIIATSQNSQRNPTTTICNATRAARTLNFLDGTSVP